MVYAVLEQFQNAIGVIVGLADYLLTSITPGTLSPGFLGTHLRLVNTFLPVTEGVLMITTLVVIISVGTAYRFVKSWIPTLS